MINDLIEGISAKLRILFGEGCNVYTEPATQGFEKPCFFIAVTDVSQERIRGRLYGQSISISIHYLIDVENVAEMVNVGETLLSGMEEIFLNEGDLLRGEKMHFSMQEKALILNVQYQLRMLRQMAEEEKMETLLVKENQEKN